MPSTNLHNNGSDSQPPATRDITREVVALLDLLANYQVLPAKIQEGTGLTEAELEDLIAGRSLPTADLVQRLRDVCQKQVTCFGPYWARNAVAISLLNKLAMLGMSQKAIAGRLDYDPTHVSHLRGGGHLAGTEFMLKLERLLAERVGELLKLAGDVAPLEQLEFFAACQSRAAGLDPEKKVTMAAAIRTAAIKALFGEGGDDGVPLCPGFPAVIYSLGKCMWLTAVDPSQCGEDTGKPNAHEYRSLSRFFAAEAKKAEQESKGQVRENAKHKMW